MGRRKEDEMVNIDLLKEIFNGNVKAREEFINYYTPVSEKIASEYFNLGIGSEDIISFAYEGLMEAVNIIENKHCVHVSTIMYRKIRKVIEANILMFYSININLSSVLYNKIFSFLRAKRFLKESLHRNPTKREISYYLNFSLNTVNNIASLFSKFDEFIFFDNDVNVEEAYFEYNTLQEFQGLINVIFDEIELRILYLRNKKHLTLRDVAYMEGKSHTYIGIIEEKAKEKAKKVLTSLNNGDYSYIKWLQFKKKILNEMSVNKNVDEDTLSYLFEHYKVVAEDIASEYYNLGIDNDIVLFSAYDGIRNVVDCENNKDKLKIIKRHIRRSIEKCFLVKYNVVLNNHKDSNVMVLKYKKLFSLLYAVEILKEQLGYNPSLNELSVYMGESVKTLKDIKKLVK